METEVVNMGEMIDDVFDGTTSELFSDDEFPEEEGTVPAGELSDEQLRDRRWYREKNEFLRSNRMFRELTPESFLRVLFCRKNNLEELPFEAKWCESYEWWTEHNQEERASARPGDFKYIYNGIAQAIYGKGLKENKNRTYVITRDADYLGDILKHPFVIMSPISYTGKRRLKKNARYLYAIGIDIDGVDTGNIQNLLYQSDPLREHITFPQPQVIVNSGGGVHVYFLIEEALSMFEASYAILNKIKRELTRRIWNKGTTHEDPNKPQYQGNCQGFRLPGTQTKNRDTVTAFLNVNPNVKQYYTVEDLAFAGGGWITDEELALVKKGKYEPKRTSREEARKLWPEWYERRIQLELPKGRWYIKRDLYDWWKRRISTEASVGHRYFCLMILAIYAKKCQQLTPEEFRSVKAKRCAGMTDKQFMKYYRKMGRGVTEEEFMADLKELVPIMNGLSYTDKPEDKFTMEDAMDAAAAYKECYCTFPLEDMKAVSGIDIVRNQKRNRREEKDHLNRIAMIRDGIYTDWTIGKGRKKEIGNVFEWRRLHPGGTKYACSKELGIDKKTVKRWWEATEEQVQAEIKKSELLKLSKLKGDSKNNAVGAAANFAYDIGKIIAAQIMVHMKGLDELTAQEMDINFSKLKELINESSISITAFQERLRVEDSDKQNELSKVFLDYLANTKVLPTLQGKANPFEASLQKAVKDVNYNDSFEEFRRKEHLSVPSDDCRKYCKALADYIRTDVLDINFVLFTLHFPNEQIPVLAAALKPTMSSPEYWFSYIIQNGGDFNATEIELPKEFRELVGVGVKIRYNKNK